jgi:hypothetical protein
VQGGDLVRRKFGDTCSALSFRESLELIVKQGPIVPSSISPARLTQSLKGLGSDVFASRVPDGCFAPLVPIAYFRGVTFQDVIPSKFRP